MAADRLDWEQAKQLMKDRGYELFSTHLGNGSEVLGGMFMKEVPGGSVSCRVDIEAPSQQCKLIGYVGSRVTLTIESGWLQLRHARFKDLFENTMIRWISTIYPFEIVHHADPA